MTKLFKKLLLTTATVGAVVTPIATVVSCGQKPEDEKPFTVGVALAPVSTLNYIKYKSATDVSSSLVESLFKGAPASGKPLDVALGLPHVDLIDAGGYIALDKRGFQSGTLRRSAFHKAVGYGPRSGMAPADAKSAVAIWTNNYTYCSHLVMNLNGQSKWANGDKLTSSNFIDYIAYTLDINNGSQKVKEVLDFGIKNTKEFVEAQNAYARVMGRAYPNPFGYVKHELPANATPEVAANWSYYQQMAGHFQTVGNTAEERKLVDEIERSAKGIGIYGDEYSSHPESRNPDTGARLTNEMVDAKEYQIPMPKENNQATITSGTNGGNAVPNTLVGFTSNNSIPEGSVAGLSAMNPYKIDFVPSHPMDSFKFAVLRIASYSRNLIPVNRHWIETHGGVENFGKDEKHILAQGPFKIKESVLGVNGFMMLEKNHSYHAVSEIIPETVKIFFQTDPVVLGTLFDDGYIVDTTIDSIYTKKFFSDLSKRNLIKKNMGWGVTGYVYNLDKGSNKNKALLDPHFRKAINFATERKELIKVSGFDTTEPSYSLIEPSIGMEHWMGSNNAITQGTGHASEEIKYSNTFSAPMMSTSASQSAGILQLFANSNIVDKLHNVAEARREIELFKKDNPSINHVKINFIHDSSSKMINIALALKSQLKTAFGDFIELDIQGLPKSIYDSYLLEGKYDMTWRNLDFLSVNIPMGAGVDAFFSPDGIEKENAKTIGFQTNPAGSWTFKDAFDYYKAHGITESVRQRLGISTAVWNEIIDLVTVPEALKTSNLSASEIKFIMNKRITAFFDKKPMDLSILPKDFPDSLKTSWAALNANFDTSTEIAPLVVAANKILMDQGVFTPTFRVDVIIQVDRLPNVNYRASAMNFSYTYDLLRKPYPWLPGLEIKGA